MQIYAKDSQICVPNIPNSPQTCKARRFCLFSNFWKIYKWDKKSRYAYVVCSNLQHLCVFFPFISLLSHLVKILNSSAVICMVDWMQAQNFLLFLKALPELGGVPTPFYIMNLILSSRKILPDDIYLLALQGVRYIFHIIMGQYEILLK